MERPRVFVCSPYREYVQQGRVFTVEENIGRAQRLCLELQNRGWAPFAPHLFLPQLRNEAREEERAIGLSCGMAFLSVCALVVVDDRSTFSAGMALEVARAELLRVPILYLFSEPLPLAVTAASAWRALHSAGGRHG
jgi:hypothetical protein